MTGTPNIVQETLGNLIVVQVDFLDTGTYADATLINTTRAIDYSMSTVSDELVDLANRQNAASTVMHVKSTAVKITGDGIIHTPDLFKWVTWAKSSSAHNVTFTVPGAYSEVGKFCLTGFTVSGPNMQGTTASITLEQATPTTATAATGS